MDILNEELKQEGLGISYSDHFYLEGPRSKRIVLLNQKFKKYINYLINPFTNYNSYEFYCIHIIHLAFEGISIPNVALAVNALLEGLLNHMIPLIQRIQNHVEIKDNTMGLLGEKERKLYGLVAPACQEIDTLKEIGNEDEWVYLTICFMASMRRMQQAPYKRVLLVCGHGYGTTTMLKESLLSEYQIHIIDTIPLYKISTYPDWTVIDYVFSTILRVFRVF